MSRGKNKDKEVEQLKRENSRLRKMLNQVGDIEIHNYSAAVKEEYEENNKTNKVTKKEDNQCPECKGELAELLLGRFTYKFCNSCKYRRKI